MMSRSPSPPPRREKSFLSPHKGEPVSEPSLKLRASGRLSVRPLQFNCSQLGSGPSRGLILRSSIKCARAHPPFCQIIERLNECIVFLHARRQMFRASSLNRLRPRRGCSGSLCRRSLCRRSLCRRSLGGRRLGGRILPARTAPTTGGGPRGRSRMRRAHRRRPLGRGRRSRLGPLPRPCRSWRKAPRRAPDGRSREFQRTLFL
jgi:hypothetical protein